jgi:hypothetical protein
MEEALFPEQDAPSSQSCGVCSVIGITEIACTGTEALTLPGTLPLCLITEEQMVTGNTRYLSSRSSRSDLRSASVILTLEQLEPLSFLCLTSRICYFTLHAGSPKMKCVLTLPPFLSSLYLYGRLVLRLPPYFSLQAFTILVQYVPVMLIDWRSIVCLCQTKNKRRILIALHF